jgi:ferrous iron transport protein A
MMPLGLLGAGGAGEIIEIRMQKPPGGGSPGESGRCGCRIEDMGIRVGGRVEMLNNAGSPVLLKVGEARVALDRGLAMKIMIREVAR